jgi:hypothetical protein
VSIVKPEQGTKGPCAGCGQEVRADRTGHLWTTDPADGHPLFCHDREAGAAGFLVPFKAHELEAGA